MNTNRNRSYTNGEITIYWQAEECIHATICYRELRAVFDPAKRPWVNPQGASSERIKQIIERCPTQALTFRWNDPQRNDAETSHKRFKGNIEKLGLTDRTERPLAQIVFRPSGPAVISGDFTLMQLKGSKEVELRSMEMVSLCRCGQSGSLPYCDGTHFKIGFKG